LNEAVYGTHGDIQRIVLTPRTVEECFLYTAEAFNLADRYQCPVILLTDLYIGMSNQSIDGFPTQEVVLDRGKLVTDEELANLGAYEFERYSANAADGISPRSIPGQPNGRYVALGNEHNGIGMEVEDLETRMVQVAKRNRKFENFEHGSGVTVDGPSDAEYALVGFGSTWGILEEAREALAAQGLRAKHIHFSRVAPFPTADFHTAMDGVRKALVVEYNIAGQLAQLIQQNAGYHEQLKSCLKYDGDPISLHEILDSARQTFPVEVLN
jgi:2-oxoglutarate ferredoxin oxidoreductase subunit alpha